ncbi:UNVERIFIED_CONTAM: hypothetical protein K2H54_050675 [Gekko kuhli]
MTEDTLHPPGVAEKRPIDRLDRERPMRGRGGGRSGMRGRGRGGGMNRTFNGFDQRGKREFERQSGSDKTGIRPEDKKGGGGARNWGAVKDDLSEMEQTAPMEETAEPEEHSGAPEGESPTKYELGLNILILLTVFFKSLLENGVDSSTLLSNV